MSGLTGGEQPETCVPWIRVLAGPELAPYADAPRWGSRADEDPHDRLDGGVAVHEYWVARGRDHELGHLRPQAMINSQGP
jgi:hypothetical protein